MWWAQSWQFCFLGHVLSGPVFFFSTWSEYVKFCFTLIVFYVFHVDLNECFGKNLLAWISENTLTSECNKRLLLKFVYEQNNVQPIRLYLALMPCFNRSISRGGQVWAPEGSTAFKCLLSARFCAALLSNISDCDETFNYWEPVSSSAVKSQHSVIDDTNKKPSSPQCVSGPESNVLYFSPPQMHFLLYGTGMQTWEYSPLYAIRSYAYLWLHALPACLHAHVLQTNKVGVRSLFDFSVLCWKGPIFI